MNETMDLNRYLEYAPRIFVDEKEPIPFRYVGCSKYTQGESSRSFRRAYDLPSVSPDTCDVLEYAYYMDYDIQHLYELEHVWVYRDKEGAVTGAEGSCHGKYWNAMIPGVTVLEGNHVCMYAQPGKHAMAADPRYFQLMPGRQDACNRLAGTGGLDAPAQYVKDISLTPEENERVKEYIRRHFSFEPAWQFREACIEPDIYLPWQELQEKIPQLLREELGRILT
ncbi:MAG: hypothetical protein K5682_10305 [Lachnospiraceae bacterium]|nr:hypothetical protein [Lachnospiraceae bacterium]